jgi:rhodanese-related sulfurtransferase
VQRAKALVDAALERVHTIAVDEARALHGRPGVLFVDLREGSELKREGTIPGAFHAPRGVIEFWFDAGSDWAQPALTQPGTRYVLYCAIGWRSALAARTLQEMGVADVCHLGGGYTAWRDAGAPVQAAERQP